jgi:hypothetical protein
VCGQHRRAALEFVLHVLAGDKPVTTEKTDKYILAYRWVENSQLTPHDRKRLNIDDVAVDRGQYFYFYLPATSRVETIVLPAGSARVGESLNHAYASPASRGKEIGL